MSLDRFYKGPGSDKHNTTLMSNAGPFLNRGNPTLLEKSGPTLLRGVTPTLLRSVWVTVLRSVGAALLRSVAAALLRSVGPTRPTEMCGSHTS